ncbi:MAG: hypothetical protein GY870_07955 [archaeon]|nr:hypothetical protein [archaeon]
MRIFHKKDGGIIQLIDKDKMAEWSAELPLIFIEYIKDKQLEKYKEPKIKKEVSAYLDEILKDVAMPRLISVLEGDDNEETIAALERIREISKKNVDMARPIKPYLENLSKSKNKNIVKISKDISNNFTKADRRKELAKKRKIMQEKEKQFMAGKISGDDYAKARKEYLTLKD